jgi:nucleoside-diphosphate-sugar epimerase
MEANRLPDIPDAEARAEQVAHTLNEFLPGDYQQAVYEESLRETRARSRTGLQRKILLIGGAGYIGTIVTRHLLDRGYLVKCVDNFIYGHSFTVLPFLTDTRYEFARLDIRNTPEVLAECSDCTDIVILAGLVGDPITKKYPEAAEQINLQAMTDLIDGLKTQTQLNKVIFVSTCSNYGLIQSDELASETHELNPLSLYAKAKVAIEQKLLGVEDTVGFSPTTLRFATAFGYSPRMRFDLTVSEFTRDLYLGRELVVYDADTWRPYCHVDDFSELIRRVLEAPVDLVRQGTFNAGSDKNNFTKRMIVEAVLERVPDGQVKYLDKGSDPRNYRVDFEKVRRQLHFDAARTVADGVDELIDILSLGFFDFDDGAPANWWGNYSLENAPGESDYS